MKRLLPLLLVAAAPPANVVMQNGSPRAVTPTAPVNANGDQVGGTDTPQYTRTLGSPTIATGQVSVGTTATLVRAASTARQRLTVNVLAANTCSFGPAGVTVGTGYQLQPTAGASHTMTTSAAVYAVCSATTTVSFMAEE